MTRVRMGLNMVNNEEWVNMKDAVQRLKSENIDFGRNKLSSLSNNGIIQTQENPLDARVRLVNLVEIRALFAKYGNSLGDNG